MHSEHGPVGDRRILVNALRAARAEIATLTEQRDRAIKALRELANFDMVNSQAFAQNALAALDTPSSPFSTGDNVDGYRGY